MEVKKKEEEERERERIVLEAPTISIVFWVYWKV